MTAEFERTINIRLFRSPSLLFSGLVAPGTEADLRAPRVRVVGKSVVNVRTQRVFAFHPGHVTEVRSWVEEGSLLHSDSSRKDQETARGA